MKKNIRQGLRLRTKNTRVLQIGNIIIHQHPDQYQRRKPIKDKRLKYLGSIKFKNGRCEEDIRSGRAKQQMITLNII